MIDQLSIFRSPDAIWQLSDDCKFLLNKEVSNKIKNKFYYEGRSIEQSSLIVTYLSISDDIENILEKDGYSYGGNNNFANLCY